MASNDGNEEPVSFRFYFHLQICGIMTLSSIKSAEVLLPS